MRKVILSLVILMAVASFTLRAQDRSFEVKNSLLNVGVGFGWTYKFYGDPSVYPSLSLNYEKGLFHSKKLGYFGIGGFAAYHYATYNYTNSDSYAYWHNIIGTMRFTYHPSMLMSQHFDCYLGFMGGVRYEIFKDTYFDANPLLGNPYKRYGGINPLFAGFIGMRFYTGERLGFYVEGGYGLSYVTIGVTYKLGERNRKADPDISKRGTGNRKR